MKRYLDVNKNKIILLNCAIVLFIFALTIPGINLGLFESWNADDMATRDLFSNPNEPFSPYDYLKPPFFTYISYFLGTIEIEHITKVLSLTYLQEQTLTLYWFRLLQIIYFSLTSIFLFKILSKITPNAKAFLLTLLFCSSAGIIIYTKYLTVDIFLLFICTTVFWLIQRHIYTINEKSFRYLGFASFISGFAFATKYNALVFLPIIMILVFRHHKKTNRSATSIILTEFFTASLFMLGVCIAMPYILIHPSEIWGDFVKNIHMTASYHGGKNILGYVRTINVIGELIGKPMVLFTFLGFIVTAFQAGKKSISSKKKILIFISIALILSHLVFFGQYAHSSPRFFLVIIPYLFILISISISEIKQNALSRYLLGGLFLFLFSYNIFACISLIQRLNNNARMSFIVWAKENISSNSIIERTYYVPSVEYLLDDTTVILSPLIDFVDINLNNREIVELNTFKNNKIFVQHVNIFDFYTVEALHKRSPEYVVFDSSDIRSFSNHDIYDNYYLYLIERDPTYQVVWEKKWKYRNYLYPELLDFIESDIVVLKKI